MTESGDPNENALAERIFRTLKEEFNLGACFVQMPNKVFILGVKLL